MKFIHIADVHLGAHPDAMFSWAQYREKERYETLRKVIDDCNEKRIDLLLIAGDLFHRQPLLRELREVNYLFEQLSFTRVVFIAGNHDYMSAQSKYLGFLWCKQVYMLENDEMDSIYFDDINTEIYGFSYHQRDITKQFTAEFSPGVKERINILMIHGGDERNLPLDKKSLVESGFDYVALGHIHKYELISKRVAYSGSLEPLDRGEVGPHGYIEGGIQKIETTSNETTTLFHDSNNKKMNLEFISEPSYLKNDTKVNSQLMPECSNINLKFVPISKREYLRMDYTVTSETTNLFLCDELMKNIQLKGREHIYTIRLTGKKQEGFEIDIDAIMRLGNILEVVDESRLDYDFDEMYANNSGNLIGRYIQKIRQLTPEGDLRNRALYLGIEALRVRRR